METNQATETIKLSLPANAAYVSAARLTASSIANRMNFYIDEIEDIKTAVSEACAFLIKKSSDSGKNSFKIKFKLEPQKLTINFSFPAPKEFDCDETDMSILMIKGLMDTFVTQHDDDGSFIMTMYKIHKEVSFD
ncbi:MAG: ATP-binding protein [Clostridiales bacterium]|jgi:serine/threonine-protein kinase RsbW|nr:ATP-binding protein [Clostridiales bacterium]